MSLVLGIDTGGTYTDSVILDRAGKKILAKAKSLTTRDDLSRGITDCINKMDFTDFNDIKIVSLSTTLATNAIVEGKGCEVGLILIGMEPQQELPIEEIHCVAGGHNVKGKEKQPLDEEAVIKAVQSLQGKVDAVAVSGYLSVRNPEHEIRVQKIVQEILKVPVVCAHHLTRSLGIHERTVTAILNARLIPIIKELLNSVKKSLRNKNINAPIMIVKGDGSLMGEEQAMDKPIETLLSGPASSIIGATFLAGVKEGLVLDMGGTTTDIAILRNGVPRIDPEGAKVGGWLTRVEAAAINTYGLGGDSYLQLDMDGSLKVGPQRVWPIGVMCHHYPHLYEELKSIKIDRSYLLLYSQVTDCFMLLNEKKTVTLNQQEQTIVEILKNEPHSLFYIAHHLDADLNFLNLNRLVNLGVLGRISVTPTDLLQAKGIYTQWDVEGSKLAVSLLAHRFKMSREDFIAFAENKIINELCFTCLQSLSYNDGNSFILKDEEVALYFIMKCLEPKGDDPLICDLRPKLPIIGIGAPVKAWLPPMAGKLGTQLIIPSDPEVANAIGSAAGQIMNSVKIQINPGECATGYVLHSSYEMRDFKELQEAVTYAKEFAAAKAREIAEKDGATNIELLVHHRDIYAESGMIENDIYIGSEIEAIATEPPEWDREKAAEKFFVDTIDRGMTL
ncbi:MAG: hydantoinase/oxoprolinase family protein [Bacillota bacterium]|nr:hydantoinase/oxoprolinase family protein [Bacillota bacterium]